jgi:hypothetical protein
LASARIHQPTFELAMATRSELKSLKYFVEYLRQSQSKSPRLMQNLWLRQSTSLKYEYSSLTPKPPKWGNGNKQTAELE